MRINKKIKRLLSYFFIFIVLIIVGFLVYLFFTSKNMYIERVAIVPDDYTIRLSEVVTPLLKDKRLYLFPASHTAFTPVGLITKNIETTYPEIKSVIVKHKSLQALEITIALRTPLFKLDNGLAVDTDGIVYQEPKDISSLPVLTVKVNLPSKEKLAQISGFAKKLNTSIGDVKTITIDENSDVHYGLAENNAYIATVLKDDTDELWSTFISAITTDPLSTTLETSKGSLLYIDLRFGNKVFYKFGKYASISSTTEETITATTTNDTRILAKPNR